MKQVSVSIIIPLYNEVARVEQLITSLRKLDGSFEVIFVDGGSNDGTLELIEELLPALQSQLQPYRLTSSMAKGRSQQMNYGAKMATGDVLFFVHADSILATDAIMQIHKVLANFQVGCFRLKFDTNSLLMKICAFMSNMRVKYRNIAFGDQGIFIRKDYFQKIDGFKKIPLMEDYQLSIDIKNDNQQIGQAKSTIVTSERRFLQNSKNKTISRLLTMYKMQKLQYMYRQGRDIAEIARLYNKNARNEATSFIEDLQQQYSHCIDCGRCTANCVFLSKYDINLKGFAGRPDLAFNCFLCGGCNRVCPVDIDGREISLKLRQKRIAKGYKPRRDGYRMLLFEKQNYIFKNYKTCKQKSQTSNMHDAKNSQGKSVLFPGCNFVSYYPQTLERLSAFLKEKHDIDTVYDCCGKPVAEMGLIDEGKAIITDMDKRFEQLGVEEIILLCPNCYYHFKPDLKVKISTIYQKIAELDIPIKTIDDAMPVFMPCIDRDTNELLAEVSEFVPQEKMNMIKGVQCCGAGGCAFIKEPELKEKLQTKLTEQTSKIYTYCATCSGVISSSGIETGHILSKMLGDDESPAKGKRSLWNRFRFKFKR